MHETILKMLDAKQYDEIKISLEKLHPGDISDIIEELPHHSGGFVYRLLQKDVAVSVFENLDTSAQEILLKSLKNEEVINILNEMSPDDRTRLFGELPAHVVRKYMALLDEGERKIAFNLLGYKENTAGRLMTTSFVELHESYTVRQALDTIRQTAPGKETIYYGYVMGSDRKLTGVISLRSILTNNPDDIVVDLMNSTVIAVQTDTSQEEVADVMAHYDLLAIPVVDLEERLVGIITHDDIIDVITEEDTEDIHLMGGVTTTDRNLLELTVWDSVKRRLGWLVLLIILQSFSTNILARYEATLAAIVALSFFIPLLIDTGGNAGTQSATVTIRALATGELQLQHKWHFLGKEFITGLALGIILCFLGAFQAYYVSGDILIATTIGITVLVIVTISNIAGAILPMLADSLNLDPALMAGPFITTIVDVVGLITYLEIARFFFRLA